MPTCHLYVLLSSHLDVLAHNHKSVLRAHVPPSQEGNTGKLGVHQLESQSMWLFPQVQQETCAKWLSLGIWISAVRQCKTGNSWQKIQSLKLNRNSGGFKVSVFPLICGHLYTAYFLLTGMLRKSLSTSADKFGLQFVIEAHTEVRGLTSIRAQVSKDWQTVWLNY